MKNIRSHKFIKCILYASGSFGIYLIINTLSTLLTYRYDPSMPNNNNLPFLVSSAFVGIAQLFGRTTGALFQPKIGHLSDFLGSSFGKRRPFIAIAALPLVACFMLLFSPPIGYSSISNGVYLTTILCLFYLLLAIYYVPYLAWLPSIVSNSQQRVNLSTLMAVFSLIGTAIGGIGSPLLAFQLGFNRMAIIVGCICLVTLLVPLAIPEKFVNVKSKTPTFWNSFKTAWQNSSFKIYAIGTTLAWIAISILTTCSTFVAIALLHRELSFGAVLNSVFMGGTVMAFPLTIFSVRHRGKRFTLQVSMAWLGCGLLAVGVWPILVGKALLPWLLLLLLCSFGLAGFFILPNAMLPDLIDEEVKHVEVQKEAVYFGIRGLLIEISIGIGYFLAGVILTLGKTPAQPLGVQLAIPIAGFFALASAFTFAFYPLKK